MLATLQAVAIFLTALVMIPSAAHALEWPGKLRLTRDEYYAVQPIYYPGFTFAGFAEPAAALALAVLLFVLSPGSLAFWLTLIALLAAVATQALFWLVTAPVNKYWLANTKLSKAAGKLFDADAPRDEGVDWKELRDRWERSHLYRAGTASLAFVLSVITSLVA